MHGMAGSLDRMLGPVGRSLGGVMQELAVTQPHDRIEKLVEKVAATEGVRHSEITADRGQKRQHTKGDGHRRG